MIVMMKEKGAAEKQKDLAEKTSSELAIKQEEIAARQISVEKDLGEAEPALLAAQEAVSGIQSSQLKELKSYMNPPKQVQAALEPVFCLLTK